MVPYRQGSIDQLCGLYSLINATRLVINPSRCRPHLLSRCVEALTKKKGTSDFINTGTDITDLAFLLNEIFCREYPIRKTKPFHKKSGTPLDIYWRRVTEFMRSPNRAVIILVHTEEMGHWTVIKDVDESSLKLFDSHGTKQISRMECTTDDFTETRRRLLIPTMSYFIERI